jgi:uncharacterized protein (DUF952 family)
VIATDVFDRHNPASGHDLIDTPSHAASKFKIVMQKNVYKIATASEWTKATKTGYFIGSPDDCRDGFIHLSSKSQLNGTLEKHFKGKDDLVLIAFEVSSLGRELKWEQSRGGELFPHLYAALPVAVALWQRTLISDENGVPQLDEEWFAC